MSDKMYNFKGKDIDEVLLALKKADREISAIDLNKEFLPEWSGIKIDDIYKFLLNNYKNRFLVTEESKCNDLFLGYTDLWDNELEKGGFEKYWKHREKIKTSLTDVLSNSNVGISIIEKTIKAIGLLI